MSKNIYLIISLWLGTSSLFAQTHDRTGIYLLGRTIQTTNLEKLHVLVDTITVTPGEKQCLLGLANEQIKALESRTDYKKICAAVSYALLAGITIIVFKDIFLDICKTKRDISPLFASLSLAGPFVCLTALKLEKIVADRARLAQQIEHAYIIRNIISKLKSESSLHDH